MAFRQSWQPLQSLKIATVPYSPQLSIAPRLLALAITLALPLSAWGDDDVGPACPVGQFHCTKHADPWRMCKRNDMLDFFTPGLPATGDRSKALTDISAKKVSRADTDHSLLDGEVWMQKLDQLLRADHATYDSVTTDYTADGHVYYQDSSMLVSATHAAGTATPSTTHLDHITYQMLKQRGNGTASDGTMIDAEHSVMHDVTYSTCDPDAREWEFRARDLTMDQEQEIGYGHNVTMAYHGVPFFWFPYLSFPLDNQRESGFLLPKVRYTSRRGLDLTLPYYLNLAPNYDATIYPRVMTERGFMLGGEFRYLTDSSKGSLEFTYLPHDRAFADEQHVFLAQNSGLGLSTYDDKRTSFIFKDTTTLNANWYAAININHVSDPYYFRDFGDSLVTNTTSLLSSSGYLYGHGSWWDASIGADFWEITDPTLLQSSEPYKRLPRITFEGDHELLGGLRGGVRSEFVDFRKDNAVEGQRLDVYPYLTYPIEAAAYFIRPELGYRYTSYDIRNTQYLPNPLQDNQPSRGVPIASVDAGLVFERPLTLFGDAFTQTLEPRLYYLRVPYRDQNDLPVFDTQLPTLDFGQLFTTNRFVGADRQSDANNLTLALTTRLLNADDGAERVSASIGQIRYFDPQKVQLPGIQQTNYNGSNYVGELDIRLNDRWRIKLDEQWNPNTSQNDVASVSVQHRFNNNGILNVSYDYRRDLLKQIDITALYPVSDNWSVVGRFDYSLLSHGVVESFLGVEYDNCCAAFRVLGRHYLKDLAGNDGNALFFEIEFKGLGQLGEKTETFLRRAILGYQTP